MKTASIAAFALVALALLAGCLEPGPTPLGPEHSPVPIPDDAEVTFVTGVDLDLRVTTLRESRPLFDTTVLFCGLDEASGFRASPIFRFDMSEFDAIVSGVETAKLLPTFPDPSVDEPWNGDNPDMGKSILARVWRVPNLDFDSEILTRLDEIPGAYPITTDPDSLIQAGDFSLPVDSVEAWLAAGDTVNLALEYDELLSEPGMIRLHSARSDSTPMALQLKPVLGSEEVQSIEAFDDGLAAEKVDDGPGFDEFLTLATGITRDAHLALDLPASLADPDIIIVRAVLELWPAGDGLFGMSPADRNDNDISGLYLNEGGLTVQIRAVDDSLSGSDGLEEGTLLENVLALFEEHITYDDDTGEQLSDSRLREPFQMPLTRWIQDWANGEDENFGVTLRLNGEEERLRQAQWHLSEDVPDLAPRLEILYLRRPDFE